MNSAPAKKQMQKAMTKNQLKQVIAEAAGITGKQAAAVLDALTATTIEQVVTTGSFTIPGICKVVKTVKPAQPEKKMISPFTKQEVTVKAKPARNVIKVRPVKALKDAVA